MATRRLKQVLFVMMLALGATGIASRVAQALEADHHLVFDERDQIFYCLGIPNDCNVI